MSIYAQQSDLVQTYGTPAVARWSNLGGASAGQIDSSRVSYFLNIADGIINGQALSGQLFLRIGQSQMSLGPVSTVITTRWACVIAMYMIYESGRGMLDDVSKDVVVSRLDSDYKEAMWQMQLCLSGNRSVFGWDAQRAWPSSDAPVGYNPNERAWSPLSTGIPNGRIVL